MDINIKAQVELWSSEVFDEDTRNQVLKMDEKEQVDAFSQRLEFGTGGLRGIMGAGTFRMNRYTVAAATLGLSQYLLENFKNEPIKVAIAHDSRNRSTEFANITAGVFSSFGIEVYLFDSLRPTPELSFAIRMLGCKSGVVLTASHNPKEYNGYKAYWEDGAQIIAPHDVAIINKVEAVRIPEDIVYKERPELIHRISTEVDEAYYTMMLNQSIFPEALEKLDSYRIIYTALHGTGSVLVPEILKRKGAKNVFTVASQDIPDGNFPTLIYPNPEEKEALTLALEEGKKHNADLILATDPDSDRVGIAIKKTEDEYILLNGNQTGALLMSYILGGLTSKELLPKNAMTVKTIVTTELFKEISESYGVPCYDTLTGFKFIAAKIRELEGKEKFIFGGEESYGYMIGDQVRDKDGIASCAMIAEMGAHYLEKGKSMFEVLLDIYKKYGFYHESLVSITKKGVEGSKEIAAIMQKFRQSTPESICGSRIVKIHDYKLQVSKDLKLGTTKEMSDMPVSNVLQFFTEEGVKVSMRPSGTEPKIKFYFSLKTAWNPNKNYDEHVKDAESLFSSYIRDLGL